jgi:hypothetical protein
MENEPNSASTLYPWFVSCGIEIVSGYYTQPGVGSKLSEEEFLAPIGLRAVEELRPQPSRS